MDRVLEALSYAKDQFLTFCQRICFSYEDGDDGDVYGPSERSRLLSENVTTEDGLLQQQTAQDHSNLFYQNQQPRGSVGSVPKSRHDDQAALQAILNQMTEDILDVAIVTQPSNQIIETSDLQTRSYQYGRRLNSVAAGLAAKHSNILMKQLTHEASSKDDDVGLQEVPAGEVWSELNMTDTDSLLVDEVLARAKESFRPEEFRLLNADKVVAQFNEAHDDDGDGDGTHDLAPKHRNNA